MLTATQSSPNDWEDESLPPATWAALPGALGRAYTTARGLLEVLIEEVCSGLQAIAHTWHTRHNVSAHQTHRMSYKGEHGAPVKHTGKVKRMVDTAMIEWPRQR